VKKEYIGDGVYAAWESGDLILTTEVGEGRPTNEIYLEPQVRRALEDYIKRTAPK
jgi:hypothetical protein